MTTGGSWWMRPMMCLARSRARSASRGVCWPLLALRAYKHCTRARGDIPARQRNPGKQGNLVLTHPRNFDTLCPQHRFPTMTKEGQAMFYHTEAKPQGWRAVAVFDDRPDCLIYVAPSSTHVRGNFAQAYFDLLDDEARAHS